MTTFTKEPRLTQFVLLAGLSVWCVSAVVRWWLDVPLGQDEARYALDGRDLLAGSPSRFLYSAGGMSLVPVPGLLAGGSERALRVLPVILGIGFVTSAWYLARTLFGATTAAWTVAVLAGARHFARNSPELLSDLPSAACLLLATAVLAQELLQAEEPSWRIVAVGGLCAGAFYLRYGSCIPIATLAGAFVVLSHRRMLRRPLPVIAMLSVFAMLLLPHALHSIEITGSITGILRSSADLPAAGEGIGAYFRDPFTTFGALLGPLVVLGMIAVRRDRLTLALQLAAIGQIAFLTFSTEPQPRFVFFATVLLAMLGVEALRRYVAGTAAPLRHVATGIALCAISALWFRVIAMAPSYAEARISGPAATLIAAEIIRRDVDHELACEVIGTDLPRLEWYSGCTGRPAATSSTTRLYEVRHAHGEALPAGASYVASVPGFAEVIRLR